MFKILLVLAVSLILAIEAQQQKLSCKNTPIFPQNNGPCTISGYVKVLGWCCYYSDLYNVDDYDCKEDNIGPAIDGVCPTGYSAFASPYVVVGCCLTKDLYKKK